MDIYIFCTFEELSLFIFLKKMIHVSSVDGSSSSSSMLCLEKMKITMLYHNIHKIKGRTAKAPLSFPTGGNKSQPG